jgi:hypothetical protein
MHGKTHIVQNKKASFPSHQFFSDYPKSMSSKGNINKYLLIKLNCNSGNTFLPWGTVINKVKNKGYKIYIDLQLFKFITTDSTEF